MTLEGMAKVLGVKPGEQRTVAWLFAHSFFAGLSFVLLDAASSALFLARYSADKLPYVYLISAFIAVGLGVLYTRFERTISLAHLLLGTLCVLVAGLFVFGLSLMAKASDLLTFLVLAWREAHFVLASVVFGALSAKLFDLRQGKRLLGLVATGEILAGILGGFGVKLLVAFMGAKATLLLAAVAEVGALGTAAVIARLFSAALAKTHASHAEKRDGSSYSSPKRYIHAIIGGSVFSFFLFYFVDYVFYGQVVAMYPAEKDLMAFFGVFFGVLGVVKLFANTFLSGPLLSRLGVTFGLSVLPVTLVVGTAVGIGAHLASAGAVVGWTFIGLKLFDEVIRRAVLVPTFRTLNQPLPASQRMRVQSIRESIAEPLAIGLSAIALIAITRAFHGTVWVTLPVAILGAVWLAVARRTGADYRNVLSRAIERRQIETEDLDLSEGSVVEVIERGLNSDRVGEALFSLTLLERSGSIRLGELIGGALTHPNDAVREAALEIVERHHCVDAALVRLTMSSSIARVRGRAARTLCALLEGDAIDEVGELLNGEPWDVTRHALVGLIRYGGIDGVLRAGHELTRLAHSSDPLDRSRAAQVLGEVGIANFYRPLVALLKDPNLEVRRAAIAGAGRLANPRLIPELTPALSHLETASAAVAGLAAIGEPSVPALSEIVRNHTTAMPVRLRALDVARRLSGEASLELLVAASSHPSPALRSRACAALTRRRPTLSRQVLSGLKGSVLREASAVTGLAHHLQRIARGCSQADRLAQALGRDITSARNRILDLTCLIVASPAYDAAVSRLQSGSGERAAAVELIDLNLPADLRRAVVPLLEASGADDLCTRLPDDTKDNVLDSDRAIIARENLAVSAWSCACALDFAASFKCPIAPAALSEAIAARDPIVRETALWAYLAADGSGIPESAVLPHAATLKRLRRRGASLENSNMLIIEKVLILKSVEIFSQLAEDLLVFLAEVTREREVAPGEPIIRKGELGMSMFVVVKGSVRVHIGQREITTLGERAVVGELAVLDPEARSADVTAIEPCFLFELIGDELYELMSDNIVIARDVIRFLCRRVRNVNQSLQPASKG